MPDHATAIGNTPTPRGGWMPALARALVDENIELAVAANVRNASWGVFTVNGIRYYTIPQPGGKINGRRLPTRLIEAYQRAVQDFQPQVLHIHGTEYYQGFLTGRGYLHLPSVISIQGIIDVCAKYYLGEIPLSALILKRTLRDWIRFDGILEQQGKWFKRGKDEREIFTTNKAFIGRTLWDCAHLKRLNPSAMYFHCDEILREPFYHTQWNIRQARPHQIFCSSANYPLKGFHIMLKAVALLKDEFPDIKVHTPLARFYPEKKGWRRLWMNCRRGGYERYLTDLILSKKLETHVVPYHQLDANQIINELLNARVFVLPSFIENSPNSLVEAMMVGTPTIASSVGGVLSMTKDGETSLIFPPGDEAVLAEQIRRIFLDDQLSLDLSVRAQELARKCHSKDKIVKDMINIYNMTLQK